MKIVGQFVSDDGRSATILFTEDDAEEPGRITLTLRDDGVDLYSDQKFGMAGLEHDEPGFGTAPDGSMDPSCAVTRLDLVALGD